MLALLINLILGISLLTLIVGFLAWAITTSYRHTITLFESPFREIVTQFYESNRLRLRDNRAACERLRAAAIFPLAGARSRDS